MSVNELRSTLQLKRSGTTMLKIIFAPCLIEGGGGRLVSTYLFDHSLFKAQLYNYLDNRSTSQTLAVVILS